MATQVAIDDLDTWLQSQPDNTVDTPYEIEITGLTTSNVRSINTIISNNQKYVDLSYTTLPAITSADNLFSSSRSVLVYSPIFPNTVTSMEGTFNACEVLKEAPIIPSSVTNMHGTFNQCKALTIPPVIPSGVLDMYRCFQGSGITEVSNIPSSVTNIKFCFSLCPSLRSVPYDMLPNGITDIEGLFSNSNRLTNSPVIPSTVTNMKYCFDTCRNLDYPPVIPEGVLNVDSCFRQTGIKYKPILPSSITSSADCFYGVSTTNMGGSTSQLETWIPQQSTEFEVWEVDGATPTGRIVYGVSNSNLNTWLSSHSPNTTETPYEIKVINLDSGSVSSLKTKLTNNPTKYVDLRYTTFPSVTLLYGTFEWCETLIYPPQLPSGLEEMRRTFANCTALKEAPIIPSTVNYMYGTFYRCLTLTTPPAIPSGVTNVNETFCGCASLTSAPTMPSGITDMMSTFEGCSSLTSAPVIPSGVTTLERCFKGCSSLTSAPAISSNITTLSNTFEGCTGITEIPLIPSSVTYAKEAFKGCTSLEKIDEFQVPLATLRDNTNFQNMFQDCDSLETIGYKINETEWHVWRLKFGSNTVEGVIYDKEGNSTEINEGTAVSITKSDLNLPILTDELWFPENLTDSQIDDVIGDMISSHYGVFNKDAIPPDEKTMVLWADDPDNFKTNIPMGAQGDFVKAEKGSTSYWGMKTPEDSTTDYIRTTTNGLIPNQSGGRTAGHGHLGTSSWYFGEGYVQKMWVDKLNLNSTAGTENGDIWII